MTDLYDRLARETPRPTLNPAYVMVQVDENTIHIRSGPWSGPSFTIVDEEEDELLDRFPSLFTGEYTLDEILQQFSEGNRRELLQFIEQLRKKNIIYDLSQAERDGEWPHFLVTPHFTEENRNLLRNTDVLVINAGDIGVQIAEDLVSMGVGSVQFQQPREGAAVSTAHLEETDGFSVRDDLRAAVEAADVFVYATDDLRPELGHRINRVAHDVGTPWMLAQIHGFDGIVGPIVFPGETACYNCLRNRIRANIDEQAEYAAYTRAIADDQRLSGVKFPGFSRLVAGFATLDLANLLSFGQGFTVGRVLTIDSLSLTVECNDVLKLPRCDVCGKDRGEDFKRFVSDEVTTAESNSDTGA